MVDCQVSLLHHRYVVLKLLLVVSFSIHFSRFTSKEHCILLSKNEVLTFVIER